MRDLGNGGQIGRHATVGGTNKNHHLRVGMFAQHFVDFVRFDSETDIEFGMQPWRDIDRSRSALDQGDHHRLVDVTRYDHFIAGPQVSGEKGEVPGRGSVDQIKGTVGVPGIRPKLFCQPPGIEVEMDRVRTAADRNIAGECVSPIERHQLRVHAQTEFVTWSGE